MTPWVIFTTEYRSKALVKLFRLMCKTFKPDEPLGSESVMTLADILYFHVGIGMIELAPESFFDSSSLK
jgi:hypothetical protein